MTRFIDGSKRNDPKKKIKKTVFTHFINENKLVISKKQNADLFDNVQFLFHDHIYGDVFIVFDDDAENDDKTIMFGTKGDEDYQ